MVVTIALVALAGLFFVGRWTTGGERDSLADERDAVQAERDQLQSSLEEAQKDLADVTATNSANQSTIDELESAAAHNANQLAGLQADVTRLTQELAKLQDVNQEGQAHLDAVRVCGNTVELADAALDKWDAWDDALVVYADSEVGSDEERQAAVALDKAWADKESAETDYVASSSLCEQAIRLLPDCPDQTSGDAGANGVVRIDPGSPCPPN
jgi:FtsZ-interacting cell division protein ZipA